MLIANVIPITLISYNNDGDNKKLILITLKIDNKNDVDNKYNTNNVNNTRKRC